MLANSLALLTLAATALASISITNPVASSSFKGGQTLKVSWLADKDTATPLAKSFGNSTVSIYTGSSTVQTLLQTIGTVDPYKTKSVSAKIDKTIGPSTALYFIRVESLAAKDAAGAPLEAFSARFSLTGMTGKWTAEEASANADVAGASTAQAAGTKMSTKTQAVSVVATTASVVPIKVASSASAFASSAGVVAAAAASSKTSALPLSASSAANANATAAAASSAAQGALAPLGWKVATALVGVAGTMMFL